MRRKGEMAETKEQLMAAEAKIQVGATHHRCSGALQIKDFFSPDHKHLDSLVPKSPSAFLLLAVWKNGESLLWSFFLNECWQLWILWF